MKKIPDLLNPIELAEKRIMNQAELIVTSINRLKHLVDNFQTHKGFGPIRSIYRSKAKAGLEYLEPLLKEGEKYKKAHFIAANGLKLGDKDNIASLAKLGHLYIVSLGNYRRAVISAFSYDPFSDQYNSTIGHRSWKWMLGSLIVPELRSYGK